MLKNLLPLLCLLSCVISCPAQEITQDSVNAFLSRIFLPSFDAGYQWNNSKVMGGSIKFATSIEYRIRNNNDFFVRINYDTYGADYKLENATTNISSNTIEGRVQISDYSLGPGYRFGDRTFRIMLTALPGVKSYQFPTATVSGQQIQIASETRMLFTTTFLTTLEYYFDDKSALTISLFENQVWKRTDFWEDHGAAFGVSIGFITSLL